MCVLYVSCGSKVRPRTFGCVAMGIVVYFRSRLLVYSAGYSVNRVKVVLSAFRMNFFVLSMQKLSVGLT